MSQPPVSSGKPPDDDVPNIPELDEYIFQPDPYQSGAVPRRLNASEVAKYLIGRVKRDISFKSAIRVEDVAKFYETFEVTTHFRTLLDRSEADEEQLRRSIAIARVVAYFGGDDLAFVRDYYQYLISRAKSPQEFEDLTFLLNDFGPDGDEGLLKRAAVARTSSLSAGAEADYNARLEYLEFDENVKNMVDRVERAQREKAKILAIVDRRKRIREELQTYLTTAYGYLEYLQPWAARRINRESWAPSPSAQSKRPEELTLKQDVAGLLRAFVVELNNIPHLEEEDRESVRVRLLRGIKFFGGELDTDEESTLSRYKGKQLDLLANEGFQLP